MKFRTKVRRILVLYSQFFHQCKQFYGQELNLIKLSIYSYPCFFQHNFESNYNDSDLTSGKIPILKFLLTSS